MTTTIHVLLFFAIIQITDGLTCLQCNNVPAPKHCTTVTECFEGEVCGVEKIYSEFGSELFNVGCMVNDKCSSSSGGQRCVECCNTTLCNAAGCGETGYTSNRGPVCYSCPLHSAAKPCHTIDFCGLGEKCFFEAKREFGELIYTTKCLDSHACREGVFAANAIVGRNLDTSRFQTDSDRRSIVEHLCRSCCDFDGCNLGCNTSVIDSTASTTTATQCKPDRCVHGRCYAGHGDFLCVCDHGYEGTFCNISTIQVTYCEPNPCKEGRCYTGDGDFVCVCEHGYEGRFCNTSSMSTTCGLPSAFRNGLILFSDPLLLVGSKALFKCFDDFFINGTTESNATLTCMANGNWSDTEPSCSLRGRGLNFTLSKSYFFEGGKETIDLVCSIFNDFMPYFQEVIISRDNKIGSTEVLAKLDLSGNTTMAKSSNVLQKMHAEGLIDDLKSPKHISLKLSLNESYLSCEDEATYRCHVLYTDAGSKPLYVEIYKNLSGFFRPKEVTLTANLHGTSILETTPTNPAQVRVGDELELNCTALIGSDIDAYIDMESNTYSFSSLIPVIKGLNQSSATKTDYCQYSKTGILKHIVSVTDPENMTFACEATASTPDFYQIESINRPLFFIAKYEVCPRPTLDHGFVVLSGTSINSTAMLTCDPGYQALYSPSATCLSSGNWNMDLRCFPIDVSDCYDILHKNLSKGSGVYKVKLWKTHRDIDVYCDMDIDGGGWTVFQSRFNGSVDFYRNFSEYENGFGSLYGEFWLGLTYVQEMAAQNRTELRLDLTAANGSRAFEVFQNFRLGPNNYTLHIDRGTGTAGDDGDGLSYNNGYVFSTYDRDNEHQCAYNKHGAWWFSFCTHVHLNGKYTPPGTWISEAGIIYRGFTSDISLKATQMKFRRV